MATFRVGVILVVLLAFAALLCAASAPTTFFPSEEAGGMGKARMLRGRGRGRSSKASRVHLNDYDSPSANHGHDPGRRFGGDGGRRRPESP